MSYLCLMNIDTKRFTQEGRITSISGVLLPPKKTRVSTDYLTLQFVLTGIIPSKKNRQRARSNWWAVYKQLSKMVDRITPAGMLKEVNDRVKLYIQSSKKHEEWLKASIPIITDQQHVWQKKYAKYGLVFPLTDVSVKVYHYWSDDRKRDLSNKFDTIADMLVDAQVIADDSWQVMDTISSEGNNYAGQILDHITTISVTVRMNKGYKEGPVETGPWCK